MSYETFLEVYHLTDNRYSRARYYDHRSGWNDALIAAVNILAQAKTVDEAYKRLHRRMEK